VSAITEVGISSRGAERRAPWAGGLALLFCCWVPALLVVVRIVVSIRVHSFAFDFHHYYWPSGHAVLNGHSPFPPPTPDIVSPHGTDLYPAGPYPAPAVVLFAPFALLPIWFADVAFTAIVIGSLCFALYLVGVRDWRCYGAAFLWAPVASGIQTANLTLLLLLGLAVLWRVRERLVASAVVVGVLVSLKLLLWPMVVWLLATRRYAAAAWSLVVAIATTVLTWALLDFAGLHDYLRDGQIFAKAYERLTYTPFAFFSSLGISSPLAKGAGYAIAVTTLVAVVFAARRSGSERASFALAVGAALLWAPITWLHYFALVLVPLAILSSAFSPVWLLPAILWLCPVGSPDSPWKFALPLTVCAAVLVLAPRVQASSRLAPRPRAA
jgi:alpha-1,2-mannosyltransferase